MAAGSTLQVARAYCQRLARRHYENFTIASWLLPRPMWQHVYNIYAFCRGVDDLGDEAPGDRLALLDRWEEELRRCYQGSPQHPVFIALQETIHRYHIPPEPFLKLIEANRMDQRQARYPTFQDLLYYCDHSANPVGHLFLYLCGYSDPERQRLADYTCTALQLTNFWQDIAIDLAKGRIYIPLEDMARFGYTEEELQAGVVNDNFRRLMAFQVRRTWRLFRLGLPLVGLVEGRPKLDVLLFSLGGMTVLRRIERQGYDVFSRRPRLSRLDKAWLLLRGLWEVRRWRR